MALRYANGFDDITLAALAYEGSITGTPTFQTGVSGQCIRMTGAGAAFRRTVTPEGQVTLTLGFTAQWVASPGTSGIFLNLGDQMVTHLNLFRNTDGTIAVRKGVTVLGTSTTVWSTSTWLHMQIQATINDTTGVVKIRFAGAGTDEIDFLGDTNNAGNNWLTWFQFIGAVNVDNGILFDNLWVNDTTGTDCTGFLGDRQVDHHLPDANGANDDWAKSTGSDAYAVIDENPPNTADYLSTSTVNHKTTVSVEAFKNGGSDIDGFCICITAQKNAAGSAALVAVTREGGVDSDHATNLYPPAAASWETHIVPYSLASGDAKKSAAGFNATEFGFKKVA